MAPSDLAIASDGVIRRRHRTSGGAEALKIIQVTRSPGGALHRDQMIPSADAERDAGKLARDRCAGELVVGRIAVDACDPLHDVQVAEARLEPEVRSLPE